MPTNIAHKIANRSKMPSSNNASISGLMIFKQRPTGFSEQPRR
jgi:hypothetical protein